MWANSDVALGHDGAIVHEAAARHRIVREAMGGCRDDGSAVETLTR